MTQQSSSPVVWALCDGRVGNDNQTRGIAYATGGCVHELMIGFNPAVSLAKCGLFPVGAAVDDASKVLLKNAPPPDVIIAAGGRLAPAARYAKTRLAPFSLRAHIMVPKTITRDIDLLIHPLHDHPSGVPKSTEILRLAGAPNNIARMLKEDGKRLRAKTRKRAGILSGESVAAVCLGGAVHGVTPPGVAEAQLLRRCIEKMADKGGADRFIIASSRRTPVSFLKALKSAVPEAFFIDEPKSSLSGISISAVYAAADVLCVTADSINMCSEACSSGKPVFLLRFLSCMRRKHVMFSEYLFTDGYAEDMEIYLHRGIPMLSSHMRRLQDTELAAEILKDRL